jgi:DGQHR domain-containing protein
MTEYEYIALKVEQRDGAKPFYLLSSPASEIVKWSGVPRKKAEYMVGYQRELVEKRFENIKKFLDEDDNNIMPGSILIAIKNENIIIEAIDEQKSLYKLKINIDKTQDLKQLMYNELYSRLDESEKKFVDNYKISLNLEPTDENIDDYDDYTQPDSYLSSLVAELKVFEQLEPNRKKEIEEYILSISKPGLILDGQHRVYGAKNAKGNINLPIVILPGMDPSEQVFHFYVINNKAKPIKPTELRAVVSTSLSNKEIDNLYDRFKLSGVITAEAQWTHFINTDSKSPFNGLINFGLEEDKGIILENVMYQVVKKFIKPNNKYNANLNLVKDWKNDSGSYDYRLNLFFVFWNVIKKTYPEAWDNAIKGINKQLLMKVSMLTVQEVLFDKLDSLIPFLDSRNLDLPFSNEAVLEEHMQFTLVVLPEAFFIKEWTEKSLDTPSGRALLKEQIEKAMNNKGKSLGNMVLFKVKK